MKIGHLFFVLVAIQFVYFIFYTPNMYSDVNGIFFLGNYSNITSNSTLYTSTDNFTTNFTNVPGANTQTTSFTGLPGGIGTSTGFWTSVLNPTSGSTTPFMVYLILLAVLVWGFGLFASRNEMVYLAPIFVIFLGIGLVPCWSLWIMISGDVSQFTCIVGQPCLVSSMIAFLASGILYTMWMLSCLEWWGARSTI